MEEEGLVPVTVPALKREENGDYKGDGIGYIW